MITMATIVYSLVTTESVNENQNTLIKLKNNL